MSKFNPFQGVRPQPELIVELMQTQFDHVIERHAGDIADWEISEWAEQKSIAAENVDESLKYFLRVGIGYKRLIKNKLLLKEEKPSFYLVGINWHGQWVYGMVGALGFESYWSDNVKRHEDTLEENEAELKRITKAIDFNFNPVILSYNDIPDIDQLVEQIVLQPHTYQYLSTEGVEHRFWVISNEAQIENLKSAFSKVDDFYIADGHHRIASSSLLAKEKLNERGNYTSFIATAIPASQLIMYEFNRAVKDIHGLSQEEFFDKLCGFFEVEKTSDIFKPSEKFQYGMYMDKQWYSLKVRDATQIDPDPVKQLDVSVLRHFVLTPILGIINVRKSDRIVFLDGSKGTDMLIRMVDSGEMKVGFTLCPPKVEEMFAIANHHEAMPPKATCIEPKMKSGIISRDLYD